MQITKDTFKTADDSTKLLIIYDALIEQGSLLTSHTELQANLCERRCAACDTRFLRLERRGLWHVGLSASGGLLGGFIAVITKMSVFK
jgi:hypothetical protein